VAQEALFAMAFPTLAFPEWQHKSMCM